MRDRVLELSQVESFWLRKAKLDLLARDPVDAANDAEALARFALDRLAVILRDTSVSK